MSARCVHKTINTITMTSTENKMNELECQKEITNLLQISQ